MTDAAAALPKTDAVPYVERVMTAIGAVAHEIADGRISSGDQSALRRGWEKGPGPAFWRLSVRRLEPHGLAKTEQDEVRWAIIAAGLVETKNLTHGGRGFGRAAVEAGVAEMRMLRILRSHGGVLHRALRGVVVQIATSGLGFYWRDPALLVLLDGTAGYARATRNIARDYYRSHATS